jgi:hypothetical protein
MVDNGHGFGFYGVNLQLEESDINVVNNRINKILFFSKTGAII